MTVNPMEFNSLTFLIFFTIFFFIYWALQPNGKVSIVRLKLQNLWIITASYLFYAWWDVRFLGLIILTTASSYLFALLGRDRHRKLFTGINIVLNLGILILFKYFNFFSENLSRLCGAFGWNIGWIELDILLPVGISFYTFQAISYSIDTYRKDIEPTHDFIGFACFVAFFPQLVAGPIERSKDLLPQITSARHWSYAQAVMGLREVLWGLFRKIALADTIAVFVNNLYAEPHTAFSPAWGLMTLLFTLQIYFDFSGYSHIARGIARMLGINLTVNFRVPLFSSSMKEFWSRWHISLMTWFRDYLYIPLGGSRCSFGKWCRNILIVFSLSGLWHGASWNFIIWGLFIGVYICVEKIVFKYFKIDYHNHSIFRSMLTVAATAFGFGIFRSHDTMQICNVAIGSLPWLLLLVFAGTMFAHIWRVVPHIWRTVLLMCILTAGACLYTDFIPTELLALILKVAPLIFASLTLIAEWHTRNYDCVLNKMPKYKFKRVSIYWLLLFVIIFSVTESTQFIYFQF